MLQNLFQRAHRSAVLWSWLNTGLRVGAAVVLIPLAVRTIPPDEFGLWYVFVALGGMANLLEFGFRQAVTMNTSYLWAGAEAPRALGLPARSEREASPAEQLAPFVQTFVRFYRYIATALLALLLTAGSAWVWHQSASLEGRLFLRVAWVVYAVGYAINFSGSIWSALLSGLNRIRETQQSQLVAAIAGLTLSLVGLLAGWRIWALVLGQSLTGLLTWTLVRQRFFNAIPQLTHKRLPPNWQTLATLWPIAWRNGLGGMSAFLVTQANTLICSAFLDLRSTASYGLSVQLAGTLASVSAIWVQVKTPLFAQLRIKEGNRAVAPPFARRVTWFVLMYAVGAIVLLLAGAWALDLVGSRTTLLPTILLAALLLVVFLETHHSLYAALVLTENRNPFVAIGVCSGIAAAVLSAFLTQRWGVAGLIAAPGLVQACGNNWWVVLRGIRGMDLTVREYMRLWKDGWKQPKQFLA